ncbi:MAG TPA: hypothetical protein PLJ37_01045 [Chitinophagales bacterium]|nr:hypothetical protein [Chitinophagales bacterium]HMW93412.1 hypothetical protein [Chitinophagales bacterium]HMZ92965.1 hypothetical protein [Chitinophagales bacterium]HNG25971.1 hypothetical protein [Chitinophagales bacterium]
MFKLSRDMMRNKDSKIKKAGPIPQRIIITGMTWEEATKKALEKKKPPQGWPKPDKKSKK